MVTILAVPLNIKVSTRDENIKKNQFYYIKAMDFTFLSASLDLVQLVKVDMYSGTCS